MLPYAPQGWILSVWTGMAGFANEKSLPADQEAL